MKVPRVWHPLLIGQIPILSLYMGNRLEVEPAELILPASLVLVASLTIWLVTAWAMKSVTRAALPVSVALYCFFQFDVLHRWWFTLAMDSSAGVALLIVTLLTVGIGMALGVVIALILSRPPVLRLCTSFLNFFSILVIATLLVMSVRDGAFARRERGSETEDAGAAVAPGGWPAAGVAFPTAPHPPRLPDIYYIILDAYARSDVLHDIYDYDNGAFLDHLRAKGFFVANRSTSNYCMTFLSLSSSLNCRHHSWLERGSVPRQALFNAIRQSSVLKTLQQHGYRFVSYASNFRWTDFPDADDYRASALASSGSEFPALLLGKTPLPLLGTLGGRASGTPAKPDRYSVQRQQVLFTLADLGAVARDAGPKFVFAHVFCPHPPFVFDARGEDISPRGIPYLSSDGSLYIQHYGDDYVPGYRGHIAFVTRLAEKAIDEILAHSAQPPIILLQADHGAGSRWTSDSDDPAKTDLKERFSILNAYYLPGGEKAGLYDEITPVNSYRIVLNHYFGAHLDLLPDDSYLSSVSSPFELVKVSPLPR